MQIKIKTLEVKVQGSHHVLTTNEMGFEPKVKKFHLQIK